MKKNNILFATCLLGAFAFSSCEKNLYDESKQSEKEIKMTDLNIPEDFQWNLTQVSKGTTIANTQTKVSLFLDEKCSKDEKVATIPVYNKAINLPLSLPTYVKTIYAQYQSKSGKMITKSVAVNANGSYTLNIPDAIEAIPTRAITRDNNKKDDDYNIEDDIKYDKERGVVYHPKKGWGTIMFEDQFPSLGDYDFNDFVANYQVLFEVSKAKEKDEIMEQFKNGEIQILISTTVIEVGVNVPNASIMVVENAERFGLAQLHQLRGRVGRGEYQSYCILKFEGNGKTTKERMKVMCQTNDGFIISEKDLELRGSGDFFGTEQHGIPEFKIANLFEDMGTLKKVQKIAMEIMEDDPLLEKEKNIKLNELVKEKFSSRIEI